MARAYNPPAAPATTVTVFHRNGVCTDAYVGRLPHSPYRTEEVAYFAAPDDLATANAVCLMPGDTLAEIAAYLGRRRVVTVGTRKACRAIRQATTLRPTYKRVTLVFQLYTWVCLGAYQPQQPHPHTHTQTFTVPAHVNPRALAGRSQSYCAQRWGGGGVGA